VRRYRHLADDNARARLAFERREREAEAQLERARFFAKSLPDGVVILDGERIEGCNAAAATHLGIELPRDEQLPITYIVRDPQFAAALRGEVASIELRPAGRVLELLVVDAGERRLLVTRDVSHVRRLEQAGRDFVANVSHELRTPLTVIAGFLETLRDERDPAAAARYLDLMEQQSKRMQRLVEDLLTLSALESSPPPPEDAIDMQAMVERMAAEARALSHGRHTVVAEADPGIGLVGSEREIASALGNLVINAVRYTPGGGTIRLAWHAAGDGADFDVEDTGIGIAPEHIPRLSERFYRVDRGRSRESGGTGLGLAIVKHALERHGAVLHIGSTPGKGSRFSARFSGARIRPRA
jgi:two-component system phosphate regulon sensor histidine kinase PhoR